MRLTRERHTALLEQPNSAEATATRKYVSQVLQTLRETPFIQRSVKRSSCLSRCSLPFQSAPLDPPYNPDGPGCFFTKSRDWSKLRRVWWTADGSDAVIVHRDQLTLLTCVHELQQPCVPHWTRYKAMVRFVRRATRVFSSIDQSEDVGAILEFRDAAGSQEGAEHLPLRLSRTGASAEPATVKMEVKPLAFGERDVFDELPKEEAVVPSGIEVVPSEVLDVPVKMENLETSEIRHRKRKHRRLKRDPDAPRKRLARDAPVDQSELKSVQG